MQARATSLNRMAYACVVRELTVCRHWTLDPRLLARGSASAASASSQLSFSLAMALAEVSEIRHHGQSNFGTISTQDESFQDHVHLIIVPPSFLSVCVL
ncbi:jg6420 [Pararge aegeria aegeria]|uniref:Jg6420 protein n=1 Tax=Pararge aegeria aegeria TaxID=348720 RepID=A0A8S4SFU1_9NEOP|nr:jg6420 [Pararge aegeria aegeria]